MSEQPPVQPPTTPPHQPPNPPSQGNPPTQPITAAYGAPPAGATAASAAAYPPPRSRWQQATSTTGRRWALALSAAAVALLLVLGIGVTSLLVLRNNDRVNLLGNRQSTRSLGQYGPGHNGNGQGQGPRAHGGKNGRNVQPGGPGGRVQGLRGLENLLGGAALHGDVTANVGGSVQALVFQWGQVTALSASSITLKSSDGFTGTYRRGAASASRGASPVNGAPAFVLARGADKVAITALAMPAMGSAPSS